MFTPTKLSLVSCTHHALPPPRDWTHIGRINRWMRNSWPTWHVTHLNIAAGSVQGADTDYRLLLTEPCLATPLELAQRYVGSATDDMSSVASSSSSSSSLLHPPPPQRRYIGTSSSTRTRTRAHAHAHACVRTQFAGVRVAIRSPC